MDNQPRERFFGLTPAQVGGSVLAATTGAFVASWSGAAGTVIGTALASAVATIGAAAYTASFRRTGHAVRRTASQVRPGSRPGLDPASTTTLAQGPETVTAVPVRRVELPWGRLALASVAVTLAVLGGITGLELLTGRPVSTYAGGTSTGTTTLGQVLSRDTAPSTKADDANDARDTGSPDPGPSPTPSEPSAPEPTPTTPTPSGPTTPEPTPTPSTTPTPSPAPPLGNDPTP